MAKLTASLRPWETQLVWSISCFSPELAARLALWMLRGRWREEP